MSVNTVRKYLATGGKPVYLRQKHKAHKLDPYKDYVRQRVHDAHPVWLPATVILREIQERGYAGGIRRLRDFMQELQPPTKPDPVVRFETEPGQQMQVDWIEFRRGRNRLAAFVATLGYSRASYVQFVTDERLETLLNCHERAFEYFGGVPRETLYDNMKTIVIERDAYGPGKHRFQAMFLDFARHYGFLPRLCRPYRAKTKGKVERFNSYLRHCFYNPLATRMTQAGLLLDCHAANAEVLRWLRDVANVRIHGTTGKVPVDELALEQHQLQPLAMPYAGLLPPRQPQQSSPALRIVPPQLQHPLSVYDQLLAGVSA